MCDISNPVLFACEEPQCCVGVCLIPFDMCVNVRCLSDMCEFVWLPESASQKGA